MQPAGDAPAGDVPVVPVEPPPIEAGVAPAPGPYALGFDALHYDIALTLPDTGSFIRGRTTAHIRLEAPRRDTLRMDFSGLTIESVSRNGESTAYRYADGRLNVPVPSLQAAGDEMRVEVVYSGHPDDGLILGRNIHGKPTAFADNWPNRARFWFPSIDHPSDKATVRFSVDAGPSRHVIANGEMLERDASGAWVWENDTPIPTYTMVIGAAEFVVDEVGTVCIDDAPSKCTAVTTWLFEPDTAAAAPSFRRAADMVGYYNRLIAPFPYDKLAHVQSSTRFGGMENVSAIFYPEEPLSTGNDIELTVAHETAHQWFGDAVTESDWHHLWLSEGFATYFGALYFEEAEGADRFNDIMEGYRTSYLSSGAVDVPIVNTEQDNLFALLNANNYQKGAWVLHMLRRLLGDDDFFAGIRAYYREHEHGTALTEDLRRALEEASGRDLESFFDRWIHSPGYPRFEVNWAWYPDTRSVDLWIVQIQPEEWPTYEGPIVVEFEMSIGRIRRPMDITGRTSTLHMELPSAPRSVTLDPEGDVLKEVVER